MVTRNINSEVLFKEEQRFRQLWLWILIILGSAIPWIGVIQQLILGQQFGNDPAPDWIVILIWILFGIGFPLFFYSIKLITEVRKDGIHLRFTPFHRKFKSYYYNDIESYEARQYKPIREYGGWGIRYVIGGIAYNVYGNKGLQLVLKNKKKILVGTQKPEEFYQAIKKAVSHKAF